MASTSLTTPGKNNRFHFYDIIIMYYLMMYYYLMEEILPYPICS